MCLIIKKIYSRAVLSVLLTKKKRDFMKYYYFQVKDIFIQICTKNATYLKSFITKSSCAISFFCEVNLYFVFPTVRNAMGEMWFYHVLLKLDHCTGFLGNDAPFIIHLLYNTRCFHKLFIVLCYLWMFSSLFFHRLTKGILPLCRTVSWNDK